MLSLVCDGECVGVRIWRRGWGRVRATRAGAEASLHVGFGGGFGFGVIEADFRDGRRRKGAMLMFMLAGLGGCGTRMGARGQGRLAPEEARDSVEHWSSGSSKMSVWRSLYSSAATETDSATRGSQGRVSRVQSSRSQERRAEVHRASPCAASYSVRVLEGAARPTAGGPDATANPRLMRTVSAMK